MKRAVLYKIASVRRGRCRRSAALFAPTPLHFPSGSALIPSAAAPPRRLLAFNGTASRGKPLSASRVGHGRGRGDPARSVREAERAERGRRDPRAPTDGGMAQPELLPSCPRGLRAETGSARTQHAPTRRRAGGETPKRFRAAAARTSDNRPPRRHRHARFHTLSALAHAQRYGAGCLDRDSFSQRRGAALFFPRWRRARRLTYSELRVAALFVPLTRAQ